VPAKSHWREGAVVWRLGWARLKPRLWVVAAIIATGMLAVLSQNGWDDRVLQAVRQPDSPPLNRAADLLYFWGDWTWSVPLAVLIWGAGAMTGRRRWRLLGWACLLAFLLASGAVNVFRVSLGRPRPKAHLTDGFYGWHFRGNDYHGFPSGHSTSSFATAMSLTAAPPWLSLPCAAYATTVSWSRMQRNDHHPIDVLTGAALGGFIGLCFAGALPGRRGRLRRRGKCPV
jgi:membrane-associated phospholipid phosphatase